MGGFEMRSHEKEPVVDKVLVAEVAGENLCVRAFPRDICEFRPAARGPVALWIETLWHLEAEESFVETDDSQVRLDVAPRFPDVFYSMPRSSFLCWSRT
jgi:hypothetical protein